MIMGPSTLVILVVIGLLAGMLSGFVGVGGGLLIVPALMWALGLGQHQAQGTSLAVLLLPVGILAVVNYHRAGQLDWKMALIIGMGFVLGSYFGSRWSLALPANTVRKVFGGIMLLAAIKLIFSK
jgi:uncharacterized protein